VSATGDPGRAIRAQCESPDWSRQTGTTRSPTSRPAARCGPRSFSTPTPSSTAVGREVQWLTDSGGAVGQAASDLDARLTERGRAGGRGVLFLSREDAAGAQRRYIGRDRPMAVVGVPVYAVWNWFHSRPASVSAARTACTPSWVWGVSVGRWQGCRPTSTTWTGRSWASVAFMSRLRPGAYGWRSVRGRARRARRRRPGFRSSPISPRPHDEGSAGARSGSPRSAEGGA
jgi:hypothetical protein